MELTPIISHRIEEIAESSCASQKSRKRVRRKVKESPPCKLLRHDALPEEVRIGSIFENKQNMTKFFCSLEINQKVEFTAVRSCSKRYELKCIMDKCGWNSKYCGVIFVAVSKDENNQIFPLCFSVADSENNEAYIWFFGEMRKAIQVHRELFFLSDRNQSITNSIRKVFPEAHHGICLYNFEKNLKQRHAKATVINLFQSAARSYKREDFNQLMSQLKSIDKKTYNYIMEEPPERWARSWFPQQRYDMLTTNMVFNLVSILFRINSEGIEFIVDLKKRTCDCLKFQLDELPCPHAIAAINKRYLQKSDYCSNWYSKET
ncbi:uncharacterized protein [Nicotiana sylvestris]|uniref:uncharacterized protein n=1 Tax=Nicotiana sylvestris TaxID=4096 RepID=UPI00388CA510